MLLEQIESILDIGDNPCISVIVPIEGAGKIVNRKAMRAAVSEARKVLETGNYPPELTKTIASKLDAISAQSPPLFRGLGIGIYISANSSLVVSFPFQVKKSITVGTRFESRDLLFLKELLSPYYVLNLSKTKVRLFTAESGELTEIIDRGFPVLVDEDYEYAKPSIGNSFSNTLKNFEKERAEVDKNRITSMFRKADLYFAQIMGESKKCKVIASGNPRIVNLFLSATKHKSLIAGHVSGSYGDANLVKLGPASWRVIAEAVQKQNEALLEKLTDSDHGFLAKGLQESWEAIHSGKGKVLAVEKDFHCRGYESGDGAHVYLMKPGTDSKLLDDAVDRLMESARQKNVQIVLTDNDKLEKFGHLAVQLRY